MDGESGRSLQMHILSILPVPLASRGVCCDPPQARTSLHVFFACSPLTKRCRIKKLGRTDHVDHKLRFYILSSNVVFLVCSKKERNYEGLK